MRLSLLTLFSCLLALLGAAPGRAAPQEEPGELLSLLASKDRTIPKLKGTKISPTIQCPCLNWTKKGNRAGSCYSALLAKTFQHG